MEEQSWVKRVYSNGLSTHPCGTPVFRGSVVEKRLFNLTIWGLLIRKSNIQLQMDMLMPSLCNFMIRSDGLTVLKAELKSMNNILAYEFLLSRWVRAEWRTVDMASSVDLLARYAYWWGSSAGGRLGLR